MKLFALFAASALAGNCDSPTSDACAHRDDKNTQALDDAVRDASLAMNDIHGPETFNEDWRVELRRIMLRVVRQMKRDYTKRVENGCDPNDETDYTKKQAKEMAASLNKEMPDGCDKDATRPIRDLGRVAMKWAITWNFMCAPEFKHKKHERILKRLKGIRSKAYQTSPSCEKDSKDPDLNGKPGEAWTDVLSSNPPAGGHGANNWD